MMGVVKLEAPLPHIDQLYYGEFLPDQRPFISTKRLWRRINSGVDCHAR